MEKIEILGFAVLLSGVALLAFTFVNAYLFLWGKLGIVPSQNIIEAFGVILGPLIETLIRIMYLGVMGWTGSLLTIRGVQILTPLKKEYKNRGSTAGQGS